MVMIKPKILTEDQTAGTLDWIFEWMYGWMYDTRTQRSVPLGRNWDDMILGTAARMVGCGDFWKE